MTNVCITTLLIILSFSSALCGGYIDNTFYKSLPDNIEIEQRDVLLYTTRSKLVQFNYKSITIMPKSAIFDNLTKTLFYNHKYYVMGWVAEDNY